jgi:hypothetical protein
VAAGVYLQYGRTVCLVTIKHVTETVKSVVDRTGPWRATGIEERDEQ